MPNWHMKSNNTANMSIFVNDLHILVFTEKDGFEEELVCRGNLWIE